MKKKFLIGALGLASMFVFVSAADGDSSSESRRPMFGTVTTGWNTCFDTGQVQADGTHVCNCQTEETTYVFWVGFPSIVDHFVGC